MNFKNFPLWEYVGKLGALTVLVLGIIELSKILFKNDTNIQATIEINEFELPYAIMENLEDVVPKEFYDSLNKAFQKTLTKEQSSNLFLELSRFDLQSRLSEIKYKRREFFLLRYFYVISITNVDKESINSVGVEFDEGEGHYKISFRKDSLLYSNYKNNITVGTLQPQRSINVYVWSTHYYSPSKVRVNYQGKFINPDEIYKSIGWFKLFLDQNPLFKEKGFLFILSMFMGMVFYTLFLWYKSKMLSR